MIASTCPLAPSATGASRAVSRKAVTFVPLTRISVRILLIWSILIGVGLVCPLTIGLGFLDLHYDAKLAEFAQQRWIGYALHPGALFLKAVLIVPVLEEVFYRGIVLQLLRRYCPLWLAVFVSSAFFGVTHLGSSATNAAFAFVTGGVLAWLVVRTRSLFASIVCHASINFAWLFLLAPAFGIMEKTLALNPNLPPAINPLTDIFPAWWIVVSLGLVIGGAIMVVKSTTQNSASV
jgi:membrane protease YdiL (CAAX protease family)